MSPPWQALNLQSIIKYEYQSIPLRIILEELSSSGMLRRVSANGGAEFLRNVGSYKSHTA
jgi:hypothetical protein